MGTVAAVTRPTCSLILRYYAANAKALVLTTGKVNKFLLFLAFVFLLLICEVRAPRPAAHDPFAPSKPVIPLRVILT
jgi:hypothetical protein